jgi:hypothetical protein
MLKIILLGLYLAWHVTVATNGIKTYYEAGDISEGCHWRAQERPHWYGGLAPLKRTPHMVCFHYAVEAYGWK